MNLSDFLNAQPRGALVALAKAIGAHPPDVSNWASGTRPIPAERCPSIELATAGKVRCEDLRPDVNWAVLRNRKYKAA